LKQQQVLFCFVAVAVAVDRLKKFNLIIKVFAFIYLTLSLYSLSEYILYKYFKIIINMVSHLPPANVTRLSPIPFPLCAKFPTGATRSGSQGGNKFHEAFIISSGLLPSC
jgi:hypothetical protein